MAISGSTTIGRKERKKEETKQKIIKVTMTLIKQNGFDNITMEQIAEEVDIAKGTLYNYFPAKEAILEEFINRTSGERNAERIRRLPGMGNTRSRMITTYCELIEWVELYGELFERYIAYKMQSWMSFTQTGGEKIGFSLLVTEIVKLGLESGEIQRDIPIHTLHDLCEYAFLLSVKQFYMDPQNFDRHAIVERFVDLILNGILC
jgi:AcrR family transcriptional regulator